MLLAVMSARAEIIDGVAAVVGAKAVTLSEIDRDLRLVGLFNAAEADMSAAGRRAALWRLIERRLIQQDIGQANFLNAEPEEVEERMRELYGLRFAAGRDFPAALRRYGLTARECRDFLSEQIAFERYTALRFKTGLNASGEEIEDYYETVYAPRQRQLGATPEPLAAVSARIEQILIEGKTDRLIEERIKELRALTRVEILASDLREPL